MAGNRQTVVLRDGVRRFSTAVLGLLLVFGVLFTAHGGIRGNEGQVRSRRSVQSVSDTRTCDDVAIIGGGVSGTYAAWRLRQRGMSVTVYEYSDRIGGRLHTIQFPGIPDINLEMGGMRFYPALHTLITETAAALDLSVVDFLPGLGQEQLFYLRGVHMRKQDLGTDKNPYNLAANEQHLKHDPSRLKWEYFVNNTSHHESAPLDYKARLYSRTMDGVPLYSQSVDVAYARMGASHEAVSYFRDYNGYTSFSASGATASVAVAVEQGGSSVLRGQQISTIAQGMQAIPLRLAEQFLDASTKHALVYNQELWKIDKNVDWTYQLKFWLTETVDGHTKRKRGQQEVSTCAKKVILAVPRLALEAIDWEGFRDPEINRIIKHSIRDSPAVKIFLAYDYPWWRDLPYACAFAVSDLPNGQTIDYGTSPTSNKSVLLAAYTDMEKVSFWREVQSHGTAAPGHIVPLSDRAMFHATKIVAEIFNVSILSIPKPFASAISLWDEFPFGAGWYAWMPGFDWTKVGKKIIKPSDTDAVFISSNGFTADYGSSWVEFALRAMEAVLEKMDNV